MDGYGTIHILLVCFSTFITCNEHPTPKVYYKAEMMGLAVRIRSKILQPFGSGMDLLNDIKSYMKEMEALLKAINAGEAEAINAYNRINNQGGPVHLMLMPVDTKQLTETYKWDEPTTKMFQDMMEQTLSLWKDMRILVGLAHNEVTEPTSSVLEVSNFISTIKSDLVDSKQVEKWKDMFPLADKIFEKIIDPSGDGMELIEEVHTYYQKLEELMKAVEKNETGALEFLAHLRESYGPKHLLLHPINCTSLVNFYKWDEFAVSQFGGFVEYTFDIWRNLELYMEMREKGQNWADDPTLT